MGGGGGGSTYLLYCHNVSLSLQLCEEELKNCEHVIYPYTCIPFLVIYLSGLGEQCCNVVLVKRVDTISHC